MSRFGTYFLMNEADAIEYVKENLDTFAQDTKLNSKEIGKKARLS